MTKSKKRKQSISSMIGKPVPKIKFKTRVRDKRINGDNPFKWKTVNSNNLFKKKTIVVFSLPGAFTPTCSSTHLPGYEKKYNDIKKYGVDEVYCVSVNDAFVMNNWAKKLKIKKVKMIPDGNAEFTKRMKALVHKRNLGFGDRSWRYSMLVKNGKIVKVFEEPGRKQNCEADPFKVSDVNTMLKFLNNMKK